MCPEIEYQKTPKPEPSGCFAYGARSTPGLSAASGSVAEAARLKAGLRSSGFDATSVSPTTGLGRRDPPHLQPVVQSRKFDPERGYVRLWIPELAKLPASIIDAPWLAGSLHLAACGVALGIDYPEPVADHSMRCQRAFDAHRRTRSSPA
ncbi:MAG TPA: FAD-binding domain-containing protein [Acidimicrobiia bacterium]|nr:FAD-binding domain-containing protein [Acidimicrobiia bacterium]